MLWWTLLKIKFLNPFAQIDALAASKHPRALQILIDLVRKGDPRESDFRMLRDSARVKLILKGEPALETYLALCTDKGNDERVRIFFCSILGDMKEFSTKKERVTSALIGLLVEDSVDLRKTALEALEKIESNWPSKTETKKIMPALERILLERDHAIHKELSANILGKIGDEQAIEILLNALRKDEIHAYAHGGLSCIQHPRIIPHMITLLDDKDVNIRLTAIYVLGGLKATLAVDRLVPLAQKSDYEGEMAKEALAKIGLPKIEKSGFTNWINLWYRDCVDEEFQICHWCSLPWKVTIIKPNGDVHLWCNLCGTGRIKNLYGGDDWEKLLSVMPEANVNTIEFID